MKVSSRKGPAPADPTDPAGPDAAAEPRTAPARSRSETRRRLAAAATALFAKSGLHGVTSHDIAREAGVAAGTCYLHFKDKEALFREVAFEAAERLREQVAKSLASATTLEAAVRARTATLVDFAEEERALVQILFGRNHEAAGVGVDVIDFLTAGLETALRQRAAEGHLAPGVDPIVAAQALNGLRVRIVAWWAEQPGRIPRETLIESLTNIELGAVYAPSALDSAPRPIARPRRRAPRRES
jgi:AcrR family transcriptional regulator